MAATPESMLRIVTSGLQDTNRLNPIVGQPTLRFYSSVYRPRTRWASQWRRVEFDNLADFGKKATVTIPILGELISRAILVVELPDIYSQQVAAGKAACAIDPSSTIIGPYWSWTNSIGHALCSEVTFTIGDQLIDRLDSRLLEVIDEQTQPVEHFDTTNLLIGRDPAAYSQFAYQKPTAQPQTVQIVLPFWWNRGPGPQILPIQALAHDRVQIDVTFPAIQSCIYTDARVNPKNPGPESTQAGPMPIMNGSTFYRTDPSGVPIYDMIRDPSASVATGLLDLSGMFNVTGLVLDSRNTVLGSVLPGSTMSPIGSRDWHFTDAYWIFEYISVDDRVAAAFRNADLQLPIEQHIAVPPVSTGGSTSVRIPIDQGGLVRDITWVAQRAEATNYNAYFLCSRDLAESGALPPQIPWWPDIGIQDWNFDDGYSRPAFCDHLTDPIDHATIWFQGQRRFELDTPSVFRSFIPALNCGRTPMINRFIYRYDFGFWSSGGLAEAWRMAKDEVRGFSNWDKIEKKELELVINRDTCSPNWAINTAYSPAQYSVAQYASVLLNFPDSTEAFQVEMWGGTPGTYGGKGAYIAGILNYQQVVRIPGFVKLYVRLVVGGSAALVAQTNTGYVWIAVVGGGGAGADSIYRGGDAGSVVETGTRSDGVRSHALTTIPIDLSSTLYPVRYQGSYSNNLTTISISGAETELPFAFSPSEGTDDRSYVFNIQLIDSHGTASTLTYTVLWQETAPDVQTTDVSYAIASTTTYGVVLSTSATNGYITVSPYGTLGGAGGGRDGTDYPPDAGRSDGAQIPSTKAWVLSTNSAGGKSQTYAGGDGYYGGGSGTAGGGGGGSYISSYFTQITAEHPASYVQKITGTVILTPLKSVANVNPSFNIYTWLTTYNMLRIVGGRGTLMFQ